MVKQLIPFLAVGTIFGQQLGEAPTPAAAPHAFVPSIHDVSRYQEIWSKSPFEFEIIVEEVVVEEDTTFDDLRLSGYSDRGSYYVATIYDQKSPDEKIRIDSRKSADQNEGFTFVGVERGVSYKQTKIKLEKNGIPGEVAYDGKRLSSPLAAASGGGTTRRGGNAQSRAAQTRESRLAAARAQNSARTQSANANQPQNNGSNNAAGNTNNQNAAGGTDRNAVIQRLLERARQNQSGGNATTTPNATNTSTGGDRPRRRRVVLPPSSNQ